MISVGEKGGVYLSSFSELEERLAAVSPSWLPEIRREAMEGFAEKGFPTTRQEEWRNTSVAPVAAVPFARAGGASAEAVARLAEAIRRLPLADLECPRLVFINGRFSKQLTKLGPLPKGVRAASLAEALADDGRLEGWLGRYAKDYKDHAFVALNTAFLEDGAFLEIPKGIVLEKPLYLLYLSDAGGRPTVSYPRNLVILGRASQATIIEGYLGPVGISPASLTNAVTEIAAGEGAVLKYHRIQQQSDSAFHFGRVEIHQERSSSVTTHSIALGGALVREEVKSVLDGEGAETSLNGLYVVTGRQHIDNQTTLDHAKPHCTSREVYKGVLDGESSAVFNGKIIVRQDAQKTDSKQSNKNLLLSEKAVIDTKPALEIYADDVRCTHGATIGQIDPEAVFYLRSRGIGREEARDLLTYAFANDVLEGITYAPLREQLKKGLSARLAGGQGAQEA